MINTLIVGLCALRFLPKHSAGKFKNEPKVYFGPFENEDEYSYHTVHGNMVLDQGEKVFMDDEDGGSGREGYVLYRHGGSGSSVYAALMADGMYEKFNLRLSTNHTVGDKDPSIRYKPMSKPQNWDHHVQQARRRLGGADGARDSSPSPSRRRGESRYKNRGWFSPMIIFVIDMWGLRWTRKRIGTAGAAVLAAYRGYRGFNLREKVDMIYTESWDWLCSFLDELDLDSGTRTWIWEQMKDKDNMQGIRFGIFMTFLFFAFVTDCDFSCFTVHYWMGDGDQPGDGGAGGVSDPDRLLIENQDLCDRLVNLESKSSGSGGGGGGGADCTVLAEDDNIAGGLARLTKQLEDHKKIAAEDAGKGMRGPRVAAIADKDNECDEDKTATDQACEVEALISRLEKGMKNPTEAFLKNLRDFKAMHDWPMPAGAKERIAPGFLGEHVYVGGKDANRCWATFMHEHGCEDAPAAQDGMAAAVSLDFLLLVDGADVVKPQQSRVSHASYTDLCVALRIAR